MKHKGDLRSAFERHLSFATSKHGNEFGSTCVKKPKPDPLSTRIYEKRRRDRMNNCLADLSRLIPPSYLKEGKSRIEKVEIIEMAIQHIKDLTSIISQQSEGLVSSLPDRYLGFKECQDEVMRYLVEVENWDAQDHLCNRMMTHLEQAGEKFRIMNDASLSQGNVDMESGTSHFRENMPEKEEPRPPLQLYTDLQSNPAMTGIEMVSELSRRVLSSPSSVNSHACITADSSLSTHSCSSIANSTGTCAKFSNTGYSLSASILKPVPMFIQSDSYRPSRNSESDNESDKYKFKRRFAKRFSEEISHGVNSSSDSSICSKDCHLPWNDFKRTYREVHSRSPYSTSSPHSTESGSLNNNSSSNGNSSCNSVDEMRPRYLPGFVLHPSGSHYMPLSIHPSCANYGLMTNASKQACVGNHPIRILVNFGGPLIQMNNVVLGQNSVSCSENSSPLSI